MLITFKSKAAADVLMRQEHAKPLLDLLHKDVQRGVITSAEAGSAIAKLEEAISAANAAKLAHDKALAQNSERQRDSHSHYDAPEEVPEHARSVSFSARAYPLLEMLRAAHKSQRDVMWGVL